MNLVRPEIDAMPDSPILEVWRSGISVPGIIGLWAGEPDQPTPAFICEPAIAALRAGETFYTHNRGIPELRAALQRYHERLYGLKISDGRIAVTSSGMNAIEILCQALLGAGTKAVAISPAWPNILRAMTINGAEVVETPLQALEPRLVARPRGGRRRLRRGRQGSLCREPRQSDRVDDQPRGGARRSSR